jgi:hypothetical protein
MRFSAVLVLAPTVGAIADFPQPQAPEENRYRAQGGQRSRLQRPDRNTHLTTNSEYHKEIVS